MGKILDAFKHAFAINPTDESDIPLPSCLRYFADEIIKREMEMPAIMFLESTRPLSFLAGQTLFALGPFAPLFKDKNLLQDIGRALEERRNICRLIDYIEKNAQSRKG